jgi:hypothetical protein
MPSLRSLLFLLAGAACTDRTHPQSEIGQQLALRPIHDQCGCEQELLIPNCEARVEQEFLASERRALEAGLQLDPGCLADALDDVGRLEACDRTSLGPLCPVYTAHAAEGEPCEIYDFFPWVSECRAGLNCIQGFCRNLDDPTILHEGEICSDTQSDRPTGWLGECADDLNCDSEDTRTCVPDPNWPLVPTGGVCVSPIACVDESYCHTDDPEGPTEESPGVCKLRTPEGLPCDNLLECTTICTDGICETLPPRMCDALQAWWARGMLDDAMLATIPPAVRP